ncbi:HAD family hydrolase, partial [bacterium]|nr:HAD family hydrolase [bacterium]
MIAILFDWDGVIIDSAEIFYKSYVRLCRETNKIFPIKSVEEFRCWYDSAWENNYYSLGFNKEEIHEAVQKTIAYADYNETSIFPYVAETLENLSRDPQLILAIVSTSAEKTIRTFLAKYALEKYFLFVSGQGESSDKTQRIANILSKLNCSHAIMIGDTTSDIKSAQANNIFTIATSYGWQDAQRLQAINPTLIAHHPQELLSCINEILRSI